MRVLVNDVNRGKGYSVRRGFLEATRRAAWRSSTPTCRCPIEDLRAMMARFDAGADVVIASRTVPGAREDGRRACRPRRDEPACST